MAPEDPRPQPGARAGRVARAVAALTRRLDPDGSPGTRRERELLTLDLYRRERKRGRAAAVRFAARCLADAAAHGAIAALGRAAREAATRARRTARWLPDLVRDLRTACRGMARRPLLTAVAIGSLAAALGATIATFSVFDAVLLRPLAIDRPDRWFGVLTVRERGTNGNLSGPDFEALREGAAELVTLVAYSPESIDLRDRDATERVGAQLVSDGYFSAVGVAPAAGRLLGPGDRERPVAVASHRFFRARLAGRPSALPHTVRINGRPVEVVGVAPPGFRGLHGNDAPDLWLPLGLTELVTGMPLLEMEASWLVVAGRRAPGLSIDTAAAVLETVALARWAETGKDFEQGIALVPAGRGFPEPLSDGRPYVSLLFAVVCAVMLLACVNVAGLQLALAAARRRELAARLSLGASRGRLLRQMAAEGALVGLLAALLGLALAAALVRALLHAESLGERLSTLEVGLDPRAFAFALVTTLAAIFVAFAAPALRATRLTPARVLGGHGALAGAGRDGALRSALVALQLALSLALLVTAGLFVQTLRALRSVDPGFSPAPLLIAGLDLEGGGRDPASIAPFWDRLLEATRALPGVESATLSFARPVDPAGRRMGYEVPGYQPGPDEDLELDTNLVAEDYFATLGVELVAGRPLVLADQEGVAPAVAVINETAARRYFGGDALGRTLRIAFGEVELAVVGVARDGKVRGLREERKPVVYLPHRPWAPVLGRRLHLLVRAERDPTALLEPIRSLVRSLDPDLPVASARTLQQQLALAVAKERLTAILLATLAALTSVLAAGGLFAQLAYWVRARRPEIGLRLALGASPRRVASLVLRQALVLVTLGAAGGLAIAWWAARAVRGQLYGVEPGDPAVQLAAVAALAATALAAALLPIRHAVSVDPNRILRAD